MQLFLKKIEKDRKKWEWFCSWWSWHNYGEQNWVENWNHWVTRISMVHFFCLGKEMVSWNKGNVMWYRDNYLVAQNTSHFLSSNSWSRCSEKRNPPLESLSLSGSNFQLSLAPHGYVNFSKNKVTVTFFASFFNDGDDSRTDLVFVIGIFCFLILNTPKLGWLYNIHSTINNKGCLDLKDIQGNHEVVGYQGEQNWVEIWNLWVTRIPMVCFFFLSSEIVSWNSGNGMCPALWKWEMRGLKFCLIDGVSV